MANAIQQKEKCGGKSQKICSVHSSQHLGALHRSTFFFLSTVTTLMMNVGLKTKLNWWNPIQQDEVFFFLSLSSKSLKFWDSIKKLFPRAPLNADPLKLVTEGKAWLQLMWQWGIYLQKEFLWVNWQQSRHPCLKVGQAGLSRYLFFFLKTHQLLEERD